MKLCRTEMWKYSNSQSAMHAWLGDLGSVLLTPFLSDEYRAGCMPRLHVTLSIASQVIPNRTCPLQNTPIMHYRQKLAGQISVLHLSGEMRSNKLSTSLQAGGGS